MQKSSKDRLRRKMYHKGRPGKIGRSLVPSPSSFARTFQQLQQEGLFDRQRKDSAADHFTWETCRFPPAAARWGHWGEEDNRLTNQECSPGEYAQGGRPGCYCSCCSMCFVPHNLRAPGRR